MTGRPPKLTTDQWDEIKRRVMKGENPAALAKEFGVSRSLIAGRVSKKAEELKTLAKQKVEVERRFDALPVSDKMAVITYADVIKSVANNLATAANFGSANAAMLSKMAHGRLKGLAQQPGKVSESELRDVAAMTQTANMASTIGNNLLTAHKGNGPAPEGATPTADAKERLKRMLGL